MSRNVLKRDNNKKRKYIKSLLFNIISDVKFPGQVAYCLRLTKMQGAFKIPFRNMVNRQDDEHARQGKYCFIPQGYLVWLRNLHFLASWLVLKCLHITSMIPVHSTTILSMFPLFCISSWLLQLLLFSLFFHCWILLGMLCRAVFPVPLTATTSKLDCGILWFLFFTRIVQSVLDN